MKRTSYFYIGIIVFILLFAFLIPALFMREFDAHAAGRNADDEFVTEEIVVDMAGATLTDTNAIDSVM